MKRFRGRLGTAFIVVGLAALAYGAAIYFWRDPVTDLYARYRQHQLAGQLDKEFAQWEAESAEPAANDGDQSPAADEQAVRRAATRFSESIQPGDPLGRIVIPRIGIDPVFVNGTRLEQRPRERARTLRADVASRPRKDDRHRGPPHDLRRALPSHRRAEAGRQRLARDALRDVHLPRRRERDRRERRLEHPRAPRATTRSCFRRATRSTAHRSD